MTHCHQNRSETPVRKTRLGAVTATLISAIALIGVLLGGFFIFSNVVSGRADGSAADRRGDIFVVRQGSFDISVVASGELTALNQIEIRNPIEGRAVITWIIDEGVRVKMGDVLIRFADEEIETRIKDAELEVLAARNNVTAAENALKIQESANESRLKQAEVDIEIAVLALDQWKKEDESWREQLRIAMGTAIRNYDRLRERFEDSKDLVKKGFISEDEMKRDEIAMIEAEADVQVKELDIDVYNNYKSKRELKETESNLERRKEDFDRIEQQNEAEEIQASELLKTRQGQLEIREDRLRDFKDQFDKTIVYAPQDGLVVYAASMQSGRHGGDDGSPPQIGTEVRRNGFIIALPDTSKMVAEVKVHESLSGQIEPGQRANIVSDALPGTTLTGTVLSVGVLAETGGWRDPNRRDYTVRLLLDDVTGLGLKPSMQCRADIFLDRVDDAVHIPVQSVFHNGPVAYVYVPASGGYAQLEVEIGRSSELYVEALKGLASGDRVLTRQPKPNEIVSEIEVSDEVKRAWADRRGGNGAAPERLQTADARDGNNRAEGRPSGQRGGGDRGNMIARLDTNGDGKLQRAEAPEQMQGYFDRIDANGDDEIDATELAAAMQQMGNETGQQ